MKYKYDIVDLRGVVKREREGSTPDVPDQDLIMNFLNDMGSKGWKLVTDPQNMVVCFEKVDE